MILAHTLADWAHALDPAETDRALARRSLHDTLAVTLYAARCHDRGVRSDMEAGMAKLVASETAMEVALSAVRVHGGHGYSTEFDVERYFRDAPLMIVGEGTNEIQRDVIMRQLADRRRAEGGDNGGPRRTEERCP